MEKDSIEVEIVSIFNNTGTELVCYNNVFFYDGQNNEFDIFQVIFSLPLFFLFSLLYLPPTRFEQ